MKRVLLAGLSAMTTPAPTFDFNPAPTFDLHRLVTMHKTKPSPAPTRVQWVMTHSFRSRSNPSRGGTSRLLVTGKAPIAKTLTPPSAHSPIGDPQLIIIAQATCSWRRMALIVRRSSTWRHGFGDSGEWCKSFCFFAGSFASAIAAFMVAVRGRPSGLPVPFPVRQPAYSCHPIRLATNKCVAHLYLNGF